MSSSTLSMIQVFQASERQRLSPLDSLHGVDDVVMGTDVKMMKCGLGHVKTVTIFRIL